MQDKTILEQINDLPFDLFTKERIKMLVIKAGSYYLHESGKKFDLKSAFMWNETTEGGEYWYELELQLFSDWYEIQN